MQHTFSAAASSFRKRMGQPSHAESDLLRDTTNVSIAAVPEDITPSSQSSSSFPASATGSPTSPSGLSGSNTAPVTGTPTNPSQGSALSQVLLPPQGTHSGPSATSTPNPAGNPPNSPFPANATNPLNGPGGASAGSQSPPFPTGANGSQPLNGQTGAGNNTLRASSTVSGVSGATAIYTSNGAPPKDLFCTQTVLMILGAGLWTLL